MSYYGDPVQDVMRLYGPFGICRVGGCEIKIDPDDASNLKTLSITKEELASHWGVDKSLLDTPGRDLGIVSHKDIPETPKILAGGNPHCFSQSANLAEWQDSSGTVPAYVAADDEAAAGVADRDATDVPPYPGFKRFEYSGETLRWIAESECVCETLLNGHNAGCPYMKARS